MTGDPSTRWLSEQEQAVWRSFLAAGQLLFERLERELAADAGIPLAYYEVMVRLSEAPGRALRMAELAHRSRSSRSRLSHAVARLEEMGWVARCRCPEDGRGSLARLTPAGFAALADAAPGHVGAVRRHLFDVLTPEQASALGEISRAVVAGLETPDGAGRSGSPC